MTVFLIASLVYSTITALWAPAPATVIDTVERYALNAVLLATVFAASRSRDALHWIAAAIACGGALTVAALLITGTDVDTSRLTDSSVDANELAMTLIASIFFGCLLAVQAHSALARLFFGGVAALSFYGLMLTNSRGGLTALITALLVLVIFGGRWRAKLAFIAAVALVSMTAYLVVFAPAEQRDRVAVVLGVGDKPVDRSGTGRTSIWVVGLRAFKDRPLEGFGYGNFREVTPHYLLAEPGLVRDSRFILKPLVAHNTYLQSLVEVGIIGSLLFFVPVAGALVAFLAAARRFQRLGNEELELYARTGFAALVGVLVASFFISEGLAKIWWILIGLELRAVRSLPAAGPATRYRQMRRREPRKPTRASADIPETLRVRLEICESADHQRRPAGNRRGVLRSPRERRPGALSRLTGDVLAAPRIAQHGAVPAHRADAAEPRGECGGSCGGHRRPRSSTRSRRLPSVRPTACSTSSSSRTSRAGSRTRRARTSGAPSASSRSSSSTPSGCAPTACGPSARPVSATDCRTARAEHFETYTRAYDRVGRRLLAAWHEDELVAYMAITVVDDFALVEGSFSLTEARVLRPNDGLATVVVDYFLGGDRCRIVSYGLAPLGPATDQSGLHKFKTKVGFRAVPVRRCYAVHPLLRPCVNRVTAKSMDKIVVEAPAVAAAAQGGRRAALAHAGLTGPGRTS